MIALRSASSSPTRLRRTFRCVYGPAAVLAESVGAGGQIGVEPSSLFGVKGGEHSLLHGGDGRGGADEARGAGVGEGEVLVAAGAVALDKVGAS